MTDAQFGALLTAVITGFGGVGTVIGWWLRRGARIREEKNRAILREADSKIELAIAITGLRTDFDQFARWIQMQAALSGTPLEVVRERTPAPVPQMTPTRMRAFAERPEEDISERPGQQRRREAGPQRRVTTAARGVPVTPRRDATPNYRRPESNHDEDSGDR